MRNCKLIFLVFLLILSHSISGRSKVIELEIEGKFYDNLYVRAAHLYKNHMDVEGRKISEKKWIFNIPDSIAREALHFEFRYEQKEDSIEDIRNLCFLNIVIGDTLRGYYINFDLNNDTIRLSASFCKSEEYEDYIQFKNDSVGMGRWHNDFFIIKSCTNQYFYERLQHPFFSFFFDMKYPRKKYEDFLFEYALLIEKNPNSIYYLSNIASTTGRYQSTDDIKRMYLLFSQTMRNSYFGKEIYDYYTSKENFVKSKFLNTSLPLWNENKQELIIQDTARYNLIIFSASWCTPCREEIPLLKDIYNDLHQNLVMTYISIDELSTIATWKELMQEVNVPWRCLLAINDLKRIKATYFVVEIPYTILVYPKSQIFEIIDVRNKEDKDKLYLLCGTDIIK